MSRASTATAYKARAARPDTGSFPSLALTGRWVTWKTQ